MTRLSVVALVFIFGCSYTNEGGEIPPSSQPDISTDRYIQYGIERINEYLEEDTEPSLLRNENYPRVFPYLCDISANGDTLTVAMVCQNLYMAWSLSSRFAFTDDIASYIPNSFAIASGCFSSPFDGGWDEWCNVSNESQECHFCEPRCHMGPFRPLPDRRDELNIPIYRHYESWEPTRVCDRMQYIGSGTYDMAYAKFLKRKSGTFKMVVTRFVVVGDDAPGGEECRTIWYNNTNTPGDSLEVRLLDKEEGQLE